MAPVLCLSMPPSPWDPFHMKSSGPALRRWFPRELQSRHTVQILICAYASLTDIFPGTPETIALGP
eukprot:6098124-Karenia_brevis.AAC.1